jgi:hypothetical protein
VAINQDKNTGSNVADGPVNDDPQVGKGHATPTRKEKEEARKRPLVSNDRAEARRTARATMQVERNKQREGLANGVERYLPFRDRGPQKKYVRDYVDARTSVGEFLIPLMFLIIILSLFPQVEIQFASTLLMLFFFVASILDGIVLGFTIRRKLGEKFGASKVESGVRWYAGVRAFQFRSMRMPKPQVKRRAYPE